MAAEYSQMKNTVGVLQLTRHTQEKLCPDILSSKISLVCPFYDHDPHAHAHCLDLRFSRHSDLEQHLARVHQFLCSRCKEPFSSVILAQRHFFSVPHCAPQEVQHKKGDVEKALKKDLQVNRKGQDQESKIARLYNRLFDDVPKGPMQFLYTPVLLLIYYATTAIIFFLLWGCLIIINRELSIGLSPKFIYDLLMAFPSFDLQSVVPFIKRMTETANAHSSKQGLNVSLQGMLRQLFHISGTNLDDALTHGTLPADFDEIVGVLLSRIRKVLDDNPDQLALIRKYLKTVFQDHDRMFGDTEQGELNAPEAQHHTPDHDPAVITSLDTCPMDLDDNDPQCERGDVGLNNEMETSLPTAPDMGNDYLPCQSQGSFPIIDNYDDIERSLEGWENVDLEDSLSELMRYGETN